jgi:hypothetical protein
LSTFWLRLLDQTVEGFLEIASEEGHLHDAEYEHDLAQIHPHHLGSSNLILSALFDTGCLDVMVIIESNN